MLNLETGQEVLYKNEKWSVLYVWRNSENVVVRITLGKLKFTDIDGAGTTWGLKRVDASPEEISECKHELTAKEYAEKLREAFGVKLEAVDHFEDLEICDGVNCRECPFDKRLKAAGYRGNCIALIVYHPELAVKLINEWQAEKNDPKGKTYLQDFMEKMPNAYIDPNFGTPAACRKRMYYHEIDDLKCGRKNECSKCWNEEMPEVSDNAEG